MVMTSRHRPRPRSHASGRRDTMDTVVTNTFHRPVDAPPEIASGSLALVAAFHPFRRALSALGIDVTVLGIDERGFSVQQADGAGFRVVWRLPGEGRAELVWAASVEAAEDGRSLLSVSARVGASDAGARERVLAAWPLLG